MRVFIENKIPLKKGARKWGSARWLGGVFTYAPTLLFMVGFKWVRHPVALNCLCFSFGVVKLQLGMFVKEKKGNV